MRHHQFLKKFPEKSTTNQKYLANQQHILCLLTESYFTWIVLKYQYIFIISVYEHTRVQSFLNFLIKQIISYVIKCIVCILILIFKYICINHTIICLRLCEILQSSVKKNYFKISNIILYNQLIMYITKWIFVIAYIMLGFTLQVFYSAFLPILPIAQEFYKVSQIQILLMSNVFNILFIFLSPFLINIIMQKYYRTILISSLVIGFGCLGRWLSYQNYILALIFSTLVSFGQVMYNSYGLAKLFQAQDKALIFSLSCFIPSAGFTYSILYGTQIVGTNVERVNDLNFSIAMIGCTAMIVTLITLVKFKGELQNKVVVPKLNLQFIIDKFKNDKNTLVMMFSLSLIIGVYWTYGSLYRIIFQNHKIMNKDEWVLGIVGNLISIIGGSFGTYLYRKFSVKGYDINFFIKTFCSIGVVFSTLIYLSTQFNEYLNLSLINLIFIVIIMGVGFASLMPLSFIILQQQFKNIPVIMITTGFLIFGNLFNLISIQCLNYFGSDKGLLIINITLFLALCSIYLSISRSTMQGKSKLV